MVTLIIDANAVYFVSPAPLKHPKKMTCVIWK